MKEIRNKMRKKAFASSFFGGLFLMALGLIFVFLIAENFSGYFLLCKNLFDYEGYELNEDDWYKGNNDLLLGYYGSDDEGYYFITPIGKSQYMGYYVRSKDYDTAVKIVEETWNYYQGKGDYPTTNLKSRGYIYNMQSTERDYIDDFFTEMGYTEDEMNNMICYKTYVPVHAGEVIGNDFFGIIFGFVFVIIGLFFWLHYFTGFYRRDFNKVMKEKGITEEQLASDIACGRQYKKMDIGRRYIIFYGWKPILFIVDDLVWAYLFIQRTKHRVYGIIPAGTTTTYTVNIIDRNKKENKLSVKNEEEGGEMLNELGKTAPFILLGYNDQLKNMYHQNFAEMINMVEQRKQDITMDINDVYE